MTAALAQRPKLTWVPLLVCRRFEYFVPLTKIHWSRRGLNGDHYLANIHIHILRFIFTIESLGIIKKQMIWASGSFGNRQSAPAAVCGSGNLQVNTALARTWIAKHLPVKDPEIGSIKVIYKVILLWFVRVVICKLALRRQELEHRLIEVAQIGNTKHI